MPNSRTSTSLNSIDGHVTFVRRAVGARHGEPIAHQRAARVRSRLLEHRAADERRPGMGRRVVVHHHVVDGNALFQRVFVKVEPAVRVLGPQHPCPARLLDDPEPPRSLAHVHADLAGVSVRAAPRRRTRRRSATPDRPPRPSGACA